MRTTPMLFATVLASLAVSAGSATAAPTIRPHAGHLVKLAQLPLPICPVTALPNLRVSATGFVPGNPDNVFFNVTNASCRDDRKPFVVEVGGFIDGSGILRPTVQMTINGLAAGQTRTVVAQTACETGRSIRIDITRAVKETDETDNVAYSPWFVC